MKLNVKTLWIIAVAVVLWILWLTMLWGNSQKGGSLNIGGWDGNVTIGSLDQSQEQQDNDVTNVTTDIENKQNVEETIIENKDILKQNVDNTENILNEVKVNNEEVLKEVKTVGSVLDNLDNSLKKD